MSNHHTRPVLLSLAAFVLLAVLHTWPMPSAPRHWSRVEGDGALNVWAAGWVGHTLVHAPSRLFDANIFYPEKRTLAFSEAMLVQGAIAAPIMAFDGDAVLAYNVSSFIGFVLTGWAFCLLLWRWTGSWSAGCVAGSLAAFNAFTLVHLTHLQFLHAEFIAVILFGLDRLIVARRLGDVATLAAGLVLNAFTSIYLMVFSVWLVLFACLARARELLRGGVATTGRLAVAGALAALLLSPYLAQYAVVSKTMGFARGADKRKRHRGSITRRRDRACITNAGAAISARSRRRIRFPDSLPWRSSPSPSAIGGTPPTLGSGCASSPQPAVPRCRLRRCCRSTARCMNQSRSSRRCVPSITSARSCC